MDATLSRILVETAHRLADAARIETLRYFRSTALQSDNKLADNGQGGGFDPVTEADRASERAMRDLLAELRPEDGILGEEYGRRAGDSGLTWILDPIDGTRAYISGAPSWGVLIAVADADGPVFGIIDQPYIGERFWGGFGQAGLWGPGGERALATRKTADLADAILFSTYPEIGSADEAASFRRVAESVRLTRYGLDCYAYALLAAGHIDLVIEAGLQSYDIAGPAAVVQAAGGIVTDWTGAPAWQGGRVVAAANPAIHAAVLALLAG